MSCNFMKRRLPLAELNVCRAVQKYFYNAPSFHEKASKLLTISDAEMAVPLTEFVQLKLQAAEVEEECNFPVVIPAEKEVPKEETAEVEREL